MSQQQSKGNIFFKKIIAVTVIILAVLLTGLCVYLAIPFNIDEQAQFLLYSDNVTVNDNIITVLAPESAVATDANTATDCTETAPSVCAPSTGIIFYPGSKVEAAAYLPLFSDIAKQTGATCFLVDMPFNQAFFDIDAAQNIIDSNPQISGWIMAGHSLGGSMASDFASNNEQLIDGLIVLGSYVYGDFPTERSLTVYGTFNDSIERGIDYTDNIVVIEGGNHAQFGNYGRQPGDPEATITSQEQQRITTEAVRDFLCSL